MQPEGAMLYDDLNRFFKYGAEGEPHPNYDREGYSPDLHALLTTVAGDDADKYPASVENANVIRLSGRTDLWPSLGAALKSEGHPLAGALNWKTVERGLKLDDALHSAIVTHSGSGLNAKSDAFGSLPPHRQRALLSGYHAAGLGVEPLSGSVRQRLEAEIKRKVPDAKDPEIAKALERAQQRADVLAEDQRRRSLEVGYRTELERHLRQPETYAHPDNYYWRRYGFDGTPPPTPVDPTVLLRLKPKHARRY